jgi:hypothetical protein
LRRPAAFHSPLPVFCGPSARIAPAGPSSGYRPGTGNTRSGLIDLLPAVSRTPDKMFIDILLSNIQPGHPGAEFIPFLRCYHLFTLSHRGCRFQLIDHTGSVTRPVSPLISGGARLS